MSQSEILETVRSNPGILQQDVHKKIGALRQGISTQVLSLIKKGEIKRIPTANRRTYELYAMEEA